MPNRIIKESICTSDTIDKLSWFEEVFFYRLIVNCDDYGRFDARVSILKARLFPLKSVTEKEIVNALRKLVEVGIALVYEVAGRPYVQLVTWANHQTIRNKRSKYPSYEDSLKTSESNCKQMNANVPVIQSNPIQSESESESNSISLKTACAAIDIDTLDPKEAFEIFWKEYPRKVSKEKSRQWFAKNKPNRELLDKILASLKKHKLTRQWQDPQYIPHPITWLNQKRWEDEVDCEPKTKTVKPVPDWYSDYERQVANFKPYEEHLSDEEVEKIFEDAKNLF
jgi:hypothetical protein